jgi:hypothetical protein
VNLIAIATNCFALAFDPETVEALPICRNSEIAEKLHGLNMLMLVYL